MYYSFFIICLLFLSVSSGFRLHKPRNLHHNIVFNSNIQSIDNFDRKELWKKISILEKESLSILASGDESKTDDAFIGLANSVNLKNQDPFLQLANDYAKAAAIQDLHECNRILSGMKKAGLPPHLLSIVAQRNKLIHADIESQEEVVVEEEVDPGSNFSDTITEKVRVKVSSFFDADKSDPMNGKFMFWYKVAIFNEGSEPVQIVARIWEIEKCRGEKETIRGVFGVQPVISPGDVYTYQSTCPLKVFPPKGKRIIGSMSGAYTVCKGNMGQHNFAVKVGTFNLILPESVSTSALS